MIKAIIKVYVFALIKRIIKIFLVFNVYDKATSIKLRKKLLTMGEEKVRVEEISNLWMYLNAVDVGVSHALILKKTFEPLEVNLFKKIVKKGIKFIDVGANLGYYTLFVANLIGDKGRVFAFEPDPYNFSLLLKSIKSNGFNNIECFNKAVAEKNGKLNLSLSLDLLGDHNAITDSEREVIKVDKVTLDSILQKEKIDLIKIDVQGTEELVLKGMRKIVSINKDIIVMCEFCPDLILASNLDPQGFISTVKELGLSCYIISNKKMKLLKEVSDIIKEADKAWSLNIFLKRN